MVFYFTATGNSLYVAKRLEEQPVSIAQAIHDTEKKYTADKIGIVCPIFGHEVPMLVREFIEQSTFDTPYFYMILTYGNRHGGAVELAGNMLETEGIHPSYINVLWMVDNFLPTFDMNEQKMIDKKVEEHIAEIKNDLEVCRKYIAPVTDQDRVGHQEFLTKTKAVLEQAAPNLYRITDKCIGCEICARVCPKKCFTVQNQKSTWNSDGCIMCMACVHACPMMAIQLNVPEKNPEARYRNENISLCEIVNANNQKNK